MSLVLRPMTVADVSEVVQSWNASLIYDRVDEPQFRHVILEDLNYEPEGTLVALREDAIVGFIAGILREGVQGRDRRGRPEEVEFAYIRALYALPGEPIDATLSPLLEGVEAYFRSRYKRRIRIVQYTGRYFFPGIDTRYQPLLSFLERAGFRQTGTIDDMDADLRDYRPNAYQRGAIQRARAYGVRVVDYEPTMLSRLREFAARVQIPQWFAPGWEDAYHSMLVAFQRDAIIGWATYAPQEGFGSFGPIAVLPEHRGHGVGTWLLVESMLRIQRLGLPRIWASWTNTPFYIPNGWKVCRQYAVFEKDLGN